MRPFGAVVHMRQGTVNYRLGAYLLHLFGGNGAQVDVERALGAALLVGAAAMVVRLVLDRRSGQGRRATVASLVVRPLPTLLIGMVGGRVLCGTLLAVFVAWLLISHPWEQLSRQTAAAGADPPQPATDGDGKARLAGLRGSAAPPRR